MLLRPTLALLAVAALSACSSSETDASTLDVQVVTDLLPATDFSTVSVDVVQLMVADGGTLETFGRRESFAANSGDDFVAGVDVAEVRVPASGQYTVTVSLTDAGGEVVLSRTISVRVEGERTAVTVIISRECVGVVCPAEGDEADQTVCLSGECVTPACAADPASCGAGCAPGADVLCPLQIGVCAGAASVCQADGTLPACGAEYGVRYEAEESLCDGLDNDCDGATDEGLTPMCPNQTGVCAGSASACGGRLGQLACDYASHDARYEPIENTCDGVDNDCDGEVDEVAQLPFCPGQQGVCLGARADCLEGSLVCGESQYGASYELDETSCDGLDNDCDGSIDESLVAPRCALQDGVCAGAEQRCNGPLGFRACTSADYGADYEGDETRCDGIDNDCDGMVDENITRSCDRGCVAGTETCEAGEWIDCDAPPRTLAQNVTLSGDAAFACLDVQGTVYLAPDARLRLTGDLDIASDAILETLGAGATIEASSVIVRDDARVRFGDLTLLLTNRFEVEGAGELQGNGRGSGGGGGGCSSTSEARGANGGGSGGVNGGAGGSGGACAGTPGRAGGPGIGVGTPGTTGCECTCSVPTAGPAAGGQGSSAPAGAGGGAGAGAGGGDGGEGRYPEEAWVTPGGPGGVIVPSGEPVSGGAGGGGAGAEVSAIRSGAECGGLGGNGGGFLRVDAPLFLNRGAIRLDGAAGAQSAFWSRLGAGGGGGGGALVFHGGTFDNQGLVTANGGAGGRHINHDRNQGCPDTTGGSGGGGGGGYIYIDATTVTDGSPGRSSVIGGPPGTLDCGAAFGGTGDTGIVCCTGAIADCAACP